MIGVISGTLATGATSSVIALYGNCDVLISGLLTGAVKMQVLLPGETTWIDAPGINFTESVWKTLYISEHGVRARLVGVANTAGVYYRISRELAK
jgi:hypothetical protein